MPKFSLAWHKAALDNAERHLAREMERLTEQQIRTEKLSTQVALYRLQIEEAERQGIRDFEAGCNTVYRYAAWPPWSR